MKDHVIDLVCGEINVDYEEAEKIVDKAIAGGETDEFSLEEWFEERFRPNCVFIDEEAYAKMCVDALKIVSSTAATDYGSSRQRDLGQLWADMTRGYLGEYAVKIFLEKRWGIQSELGHELGELDDFLPTDIHRVKLPDEQVWRQPRLNIGIKTTKWNGIWFDIPGDQFNHSDVHILVKVGTGQDHLFAFFKSLSVFRDKVLKRGQEVGVLSPEEVESLYNSLPSFRPIPAYICGFVQRDGSYETLSYKGKLGRKNYTITEWNGPINPGDLDRIKAENNVPGKIQFQSIGSFAHERGYLFNTGNLKWKSEDWERIVERL